MFGDIIKREVCHMNQNRGNNKKKKHVNFCTEIVYYIISFLLLYIYRWTLLEDTMMLEIM